MAEKEEKEGRLIMVAVDESEESFYALSWCLKYIIAPDSDGNYEDTLILVHARRPRPVYSSMDGTGYLFTPDITASLDEFSEAAMAKANQICSHIPNVKSKVEVGDPRDVICDAVEQMHADLLVLGSHGYGPIQRALLGSVSNHCAQNVKCPVLIVKRPKH
ncbi:hypothetical protein LUZ60_003491 [Juncus effusus]|nr:hypothetical protein LUZ60_003491 [Juncus effusus]